MTIAAIRGVIRCVSPAGRFTGQQEEISQLCDGEWKGRALSRTRTDPRSFDLTHPCPVCGYKIPPRELFHRKKSSKAQTIAVYYVRYLELTNPD